jgi:hypothetical protein
VRRPDDDLRGAEAFSEHYSITERNTVEAAMQDAARQALSQYCLLFSGVADGLDLKYYPRRSTGSAGGMIVSLVGEGNLRLRSMVNLVALCWGLVLKCYELRTRQHKILNVNALRSLKHYFP